ncbi:MAG: beta-ketoacyl-[acyl-carrier-protein] synthase family protein [Vicinamibacterales bacterium]
MGAGVRTPAGATIDALWDAVCAGRSSAIPHADDRLPHDARLLVCPIQDFDPADFLTPVECRRFDRVHQLAVAAAEDALRSAGPDRPPPERCAVVCGSGIGAAATVDAQHLRLQASGVRGLSPLVVPMTMGNAAAALLSLRFGFTGPCLTVSTACASGATAIAEGLELLRRGAADLVLAGGAEAPLTLSTLAGFLRLDVMSRRVDAPALASRPFDVDRDGFVMGEGAAFVVLQRAEATPGGGAPARRSLGRVLGQASNADAHHLVAPSPGGEGALACMRAALTDAGLGPSDVAHVNAHGTGTGAGDLAEALALSRLFDGAPPAVTAVKGATGHLVAASGVVEAIVTLRAIAEGVVPPVAGLRRLDPACPVDAVIGQPRSLGAGAALSASFGFGGLNTVLVLGAA